MYPWGEESEEDREAFVQGLMHSRTKGKGGSQTGTARHKELIFASVDLSRSKAISFASIS